MGGQVSTAEPSRTSGTSEDGRATTATSTTAVYGGDDRDKHPRHLGRRRPDAAEQIFEGAGFGVQDSWNMGDSWNTMSGKRKIRQAVPTQTRRGNTRKMTGSSVCSPVIPQDVGLCANSGLPAAEGYSHCCRTCKVTEGKSHGPSCQMFVRPPREEAADVDYDSDDSEVVSLPDKEELRQTAKKHQMDVGCTNWGEDGVHTWMPIWNTNRHELGQFGTGVRLYFEFLIWVGTSFVVLQFLSLPMLIMTAIGSFGEDMMDKETNFAISWKEQSLVRFTLGNLGLCGSDSHCETRSSRVMRSFSDVLGSDWKLKDVTFWYSLNDCLVVVVFAVSMFIFRKWRVPQVIEEVDEENITATDYSFRVGGLPDVLGCPPGATREQKREAAKGEEHARYAEKLQEHFEKLLAAMFPPDAVSGVIEEPRIVEIVLVRDWERAIGKYQEQGSWLLKKENVKKKLALCRSKAELGSPSEKAGTEAKVARLQQELKKIDGHIHHLEDKLDEKEKPTYERPVRGAFVIVNEERFKDRIIRKYRPHNSRMTSWVSKDSLKFEGRRITCKEAREPMDTIWENMDFPSKKALILRFLTGGLTVILVLCVVFGGAFLRSVPLRNGLVPPDSTVWSMYNSTSCWEMSDLKFYSDALCTQEITDYDCVDPDGGTISSTACQSMLTAFESASCAGATGTAYGVAVKFNASTAVNCVAATLGPATTADFIQFEACDGSFDVANLKSSEWQAGPACTLLKPLDLPEWPQGVAGTGGETMTVQRTADLEEDCSFFDDTLDEAIEVLAEIEARGYTTHEIAFEPRLACFCETTRQNSDPDWAWIEVAPGEDATPEHTVCKEWLVIYRWKIWRAQTAGLAVVVANQFLKFIFRVMDKMNFHKSRTKSSLGSMAKLCFTQVLVTGFMVLLCSLNFRRFDATLARFDIREKGEYFDDCSVGWYLAVASGYYVVLAGNCTAVLGIQLAMKFVLGPFVRWFRGRNVYVTVLANEANEFFEWNVAGRFAESLTIIFCTMLFSGIMPGLYTIGATYCFFAYWIDKWRLLKDCVRPPNYHHRMVNLGIQVARLAVVMHMLIAMYTFGVQDVFPSDWGPSWARKFVEGVTGVSESEYDDIMLVYESHGHDDYQVARINDLGRKSVLPVVLIFLPYFALFIKFLIELIFKPCVSPIAAVFELARHRTMKKVTAAAPMASSEFNVFSRTSALFSIKRSVATSETYSEIMDKQKHGDADRRLEEVQRGGGGECADIWVKPPAGAASKGEASIASVASLEHRQVEEVYTKQGQLMSYDLKFHPKYERTYKALAYDEKHSPRKDARTAQSPAMGASHTLEAI